MTSNDIRAAIEAILFVAGESVTLEDLAAAVPEATREAVEAAVTEMTEGYADPSHGFTVEKSAGGYRFVTRPEVDSHLRKFFARRGEGRLSMAALETLSIIAYRQPVTSPEISEIRGVNTAGVIHTLLERRLIRILGRKNVVGSPFLYRTTKEFLTHFGLDSLQDLPKLEEFAEVLGESAEEIREEVEQAAVSQE
jgi:segregation and condensation protein B